MALALVGLETGLILEDFGTSFTGHAQVDVRVLGSNMAIHIALQSTRVGTDSTIQCIQIHPIHLLVNVDFER